MTKAEIRDAYNNLTPALQAVLDEYKSKTGTDYPTGKCTGNMAPSAVMDYKDNLEGRLYARTGLIETVKNAIKNYEFSQTEEGKAFISHLHDKQEDINNQILAVETMLADEFNKTLTEIGMGDWSVYKNNIRTGRYTSFAITKGDAEITIRVENKYSGESYIEPSSSMLMGEPSKAGDITGRQYQQYKAFCTIIENGDKMNEFLKKYNEWGRHSRILEEQAKEVDKWVDNPLEVYTK